MPNETFKQGYRSEPRMTIIANTGIGLSACRPGALAAACWRRCSSGCCPTMRPGQACSARAEGTHQDHALADAKGRLMAIPLTGGEVYDCPVAERFIRARSHRSRLRDDKAYDSAQIARQARSAEPNRAFPTAATESNRSASANGSTSFAGVSRLLSTEFSVQPLRPARPKLSCFCLSRCRSCKVDLISSKLGLLASLSAI